jgi:nucleotide-binding universal stress UspA family protein
MIKGVNILVCSDFSSNSDLALKAAKNLSSRANSLIHVLHVDEFPAFWEYSGTPIITDYFDEKFECKILDLSRKRLVEQMNASEVNGKVHVSFGFPFQVISDHIRENNIGVLIMGHKGTGGHFHFGGLAAKMIASSPVPVLIVKKEMKQSKVSVLIDPNEKMTELISSAKEMASVLSCSLETVSVFPDWSSRFIGFGKLGVSTKLLSLSPGEKVEICNKTSELIRKELGNDTRADIKVEVTQEKKVAFHLNSILSADHSPLVVMKRHQSSMFEKIIIGSETRRMLEIYNGNLLILPP